MWGWSEIFSNYNLPQNSFWGLRTHSYYRGEAPFTGCAAGERFGRGRATGSKELPLKRVGLFNSRPPQFLKKRSENGGANEFFFVWVPLLSGNRSGSCSEISGFRIAQVVGCHSENGILYSENGILNSESCSENTLELSESSENGPSAPRALFVKLGWSPGF